jgi:hypothetical protein
LLASLGSGPPPRTARQSIGIVCQSVLAQVVLLLLVVVPLLADTTSCTRTTAS